MLWLNQCFYKLKFWGGRGILNDIEINLPFVVVTSLAFTGLPDVFHICCMYTFLESYLCCILAPWKKKTWAVTLSTRWVIFPDATALILEKGNVSRQSHKQNVLFDLEHFLQAALHVALGSNGDITWSLNQCSYKTYDNLSKSDSAESLLFLHRRAKGRSRRRDEQHSKALGMWWWCFILYKLSRIMMKSLPRHQFS